MTAVAVRSARPGDVDQLAQLFDQLGHQQDVDELHARLERMRADPRAGVLVAEDVGMLVGAATYFFLPVAHDDRPWCRITTLVVDEARRGHGIGRLLVEAAERSRSGRLLLSHRSDQCATSRRRAPLVYGPRLRPNLHALPEAASLSVNGFFQLHTSTGDAPNPLWQFDGSVDLLTPMSKP
jgi:GNAT superfamily N-acetyltransferase